MNITCPSPVTKATLPTSLITFGLKLRPTIKSNNVIPNWENTSNRGRVDVFLGLHQPVMYNPREISSPFSELAANGQKTSRYLLGEIPKGTDFEGINKPRMRFDDLSAVPVGKDGTGRALYRHIFLNLDNSPKELEELVIHELAHSVANHIFYRPSDHHNDFKW